MVSILVHKIDCLGGIINHLLDPVAIEDCDLSSACTHYFKSPRSRMSCLTGKAIMPRESDRWNDTVIDGMEFMAHQHRKCE